MVDEEQANQEAMKLALAEMGLTPAGSEKVNQHSFLRDVVLANDTTRLGNLTEEELGKLSLTLRACKELSLISSKIMNNQFFSDYFISKGEIQTAPSLSKNAKLIDLAVVQRREVTAKTRHSRKVNKGWFGKKEEVIEQ